MGVGARGVGRHQRPHRRRLVAIDEERPAPTLCVETGLDLCRRAHASDITYGCVVDNVNVSVLLYAPVRSASVAPIDCLNVSVTASLLTGPA